MTPLSSLPAGSVFDLSARTKLRLSGADRVRFLNGQVTNDVRKARNDFAVHACVITAKGKTNGDLFVSAQDEALMIDADEALRESLAARLERYIIADDAALEDVTDKYALFHVVTEERIDWPNGVWIRAERWDVAGWDLWVPAAEHDAALERLARLGHFQDATAAEVLRIECGIPRWGRELTEDIIPIEAGLESACVDYSKGCYIGQEVISRMKMSGQTNKRLCALSSLHGKSLSVPAMLMNSESENKNVGRLTSATFSPRLGQWLGLGYVKRGACGLGQELIAVPQSGEAVEVRIVNPGVG